MKRNLASNSGKPRRRRRSRREVQAGLGKRIRAMRKDRGWSQGELARRCGIRLGLLGAIERGHENFTMATLLPVAKKLKTTLAELFAGID